MELWHSKQTKWWHWKNAKSERIILATWALCRISPLQPIPESLAVIVSMSWCSLRLNSVDFLAKFMCFLELCWINLMDKSLISSKKWSNWILRETEEIFRQELDDFIWMTICLGPKMNFSLLYSLCPRIGVSFSILVRPRIGVPVHFYPKWYNRVSPSTNSFHSHFI